MKPLIPYLFFNGNCREAMEFYKNCFGGKLDVMSYADAPENNNACPDGNAPPAQKDQVMHAMLASGELMIMASDNPMKEPTNGDNAQICVQCESVDQIEKLFKQLGEGGKVAMPLENTFWKARFGVVIDKYGFYWMLNCPLG